jgi:glutaminyl-peptide cyclotransferase
MSVEIKFEPDGRNGLIAEGTYLWDAAKRLGVRLPAECNGRGECDTCAVVVEEGATLLSSLTEAERTRLSPERLAAGERLACQAKVEHGGEVVLRAVPATERAETSAETEKDLRKEFSELPLTRKLTTLVELEAVTLFQTLDALINVPFAIGGKVMELMAVRGRSLDDRKQAARRPLEHHQPEEEKAVSDAQAGADERIYSMIKFQSSLNQQLMPKSPADKESKREHMRTACVTLKFLLVLTLPLFLSACPGNSNKQSGNINTNATPTPTASPAQTRLTIDGNRAFEYVRKQVEFGPHPAGSAELGQVRDYIAGELKSYGGLNVMFDEFTAKTPQGDKKMVNVTAELPGELSDVIIISSHYDTKYFKDFRFVGANDAGSSTGTLLEIARAMAQSGQKPKFTYWFVFFDGEEAFCKEWEDCKNPDGPDNTYGSRHYVQQLREKNQLQRVRAMILLDMMGYKNLRLGRDTEMSSRWLIDTVWQTAQDLGYGSIFVDDMEGVGGDDHEPFLKAGIDSLDIIQLSSYEYWHTPDDTLDKISPQSLKIVGDVVLASLPRIEQRLLSRRGQ